MRASMTGGGPCRDAQDAPRIPQKNANVQVLDGASAGVGAGIDSLAGDVTSDPTATAGRLWRGQAAGARRIEQSERLLRAAAAVAVRVGYAATSAEAISREAKMSKATFYAHFANKEACFLALLEIGAQRALERLVAGARDAGDDAADRQRAGLRAFLSLVGEEPEMSRAILVEGLSSGPAAVARRDELFAGFAEVMFQETERGADAGGGPRFATVYDALGVVGAVVELTSRHLRSGKPETLDEVQASVERILFGVLVDDVSGLR